MKKAIRIQSQNIQAGHISPVKSFGFVAINIDGIKLTFDAYNGSGPTATPRTDSLIQIIDDKEVFELTPSQLLDTVRFFNKYAEMGKDVVRFKNIFHVVIPDRFRDAVKQSENGLKI